MALASRLLPALVLVAACTPRQAPHQTLVAPSAAAPEAERIAAHERLFARADAVSGVRGGTMRTDYLVLGDGTRIHHPEDLIPVVDPASPTARAAAKSAAASESLRRSRSRGSIPWYVAGAGIAAGMVVMFSGVRSDDGGGDLILAGTGLMVGSLVGGLVAGLILEGDAGERHVEARDERVSAFATYNDDLVKRLALCAEGGDVVPCAAPAEAAAPAAAATPGDGPSAAAP
jgi:hypothetical protein